MCVVQRRREGPASAASLGNARSRACQLSGAFPHTGGGSASPSECELDARAPLTAAGSRTQPPQPAADEAAPAMTRLVHPILRTDRMPLCVPLTLPLEVKLSLLGLPGARWGHHGKGQRSSVRDPGTSYAPDQRQTREHSQALPIWHSRPGPSPTASRPAQLTSSPSGRPATITPSSDLTPVSHGGQPAPLRPHLRRRLWRGSGPSAPLTPARRPRRACREHPGR